MQGFFKQTFCALLHIFISYAYVHHFPKTDFLTYTVKAYTNMPGGQSEKKCYHAQTMLKILYPFQG